MLTSFSGERIIFSRSGVEKTGYSHVNNNVRPLLYTLQKANPKRIKATNVRTKTINPLEENGAKALLHWIRQCLFEHDTKRVGNKRKNRQSAFHQYEKAVCIKAHYQQIIYLIWN